MQLEEVLRRQGFDFINGPIRNQKLAQLWLKKDDSRITLFSDHITHTFKSSYNLQSVTSDALYVNFTEKQTFNFNIGMTFLQRLFQSLGMGHLGIETKIKTGKDVSISFDEAVCEEYGEGDLLNFFSKESGFDLTHYNPNIIDYLNNDDLIIASGILSAKNLKITINTNADISGSVKLDLEQITDSSLSFDFTQKNTLIMNAAANKVYPIAVKAHRLYFRYGEFQKMDLVTDSRNFY